MIQTTSCSFAFLSSSWSAGSPFAEHFRELEFGGTEALAYLLDRRKETGPVQFSPLACDVLDVGQHLEHCCGYRIGAQVLDVVVIDAAHTPGDALKIL